jgi:hypothetical protein
VTEEYRLSRHRTRLVARAFLALALLFAQAGAQAHAYSHLRDTPGAPGGDHGCPTCVLFAPLLSAAGDAPGTVAAHPLAAERVDGAAPAPLYSLLPRRAFQARAPPSRV